MSTSQVGADEIAEGSPAGSRAEGPTDLRPYLYVGVMILVGSTTAAAARYIVRELPPAWIPVIRFGIGGLVLLPVVADWRILARIFRRDWPLLLGAAAMGVPINQGFFLNAARLGPTSHVGLFYATSPLVVLLLAWTLRLERLDLGRFWGILASVAGVGIIGIGSLWHSGSPPAEARATMLADLLLIGAVLSWGAYLTLSKPLVMRHGSLPVLTACFLSGALLDLPIAWISSPAIPHLSHVTPIAWTALAVLTLLITPVNLACQNLAMRRFDASQVANFSNVSPVLTVVWGVWLFGETISASLVLGGLLTMAGVLWTGWNRAGHSSGVEPNCGLAGRGRRGRTTRIARGEPAPSPSSAVG